ncbi:MAG: hypothetical protein N3E36_01890 [Sulfolobales archaeon]|nr:hypothetical protein [Sulfolobales archaeon]MCX8198765.1 hypothetical protein [Sulfolobales archaeon]MDW8169838.1 hypothetical protein [Desulfurococcaceae archaeon]
MKFPWTFLKGKWILIGHEAWARDIISIYLALLASINKKVYIASSRSWRVELLDILKENVVNKAELGNIYIVEGIEAWNTGPEEYVILIDPSILPSPHEVYNAFVSISPEGANAASVKHLYSWRKAYLKRLHGSEFTIKVRNTSLRITINLNYIGLSQPIEGTYREALRMLRQGTVDYGVLSIKDALDIITYGMKIKRSNARNILSELIKRGYVTISNGHLIVR